MRTATFLALILVCLSTPAQAHESATSDSIIVHVNETGFTPREITIMQGTTVIFENDGAESHWPASDSHPSHTFYSGTSLTEHCGPVAEPVFDACSDIKPTQTWSFTFEKTGEHLYHDHLWPHLQGKIIVEETPSLLAKITTWLQDTVKTIVSWFTKDPLYSAHARPDFLKESLEKYRHLTEDADPRSAMESLESEAKENGELAAVCHDVLHAIGKTAYQKYQGFDNSIVYQNNYCNSGYIHGLIEAHLIKSSTTTDLTSLCRTFAQNRTPFEAWQCYHGIGHGLMYTTGGDLESSLALCTSSFQGDQANSCINGVYMEVFNNELLAKESEFIVPNDPFATCDARATSKHDCYLYTPTYFSNVLQISYEDILEKCKETKPGFRQTCIFGVGSEAIKRNMDAPDKVFSLCDTLHIYEDKTSCITGVVTTYLYQSGTHEAGVAMCEAQDETYRGLCDKILEANEEFFGVKKQ